jgi:hypothetical protein
MQQFEALCGECAEQQAHAGNIAARSVEAGDKARLDRIRVATYEHDGNRSGRFLCGQCRRTATDCCEHGHLPAGEVSSQCRQPIRMSLCVPVLDRDVLPLNVA